MADDVGVLCSSKKNEMKECFDRFELGLTKSYKYDVGYSDGKYKSKKKDSKLEKIAKKYMDGTHPVKLVIATGGVVALEAAVKAADATKSAIPIIYIIGRAPITGLTDHANASGGVNLSLPSMNKARVDELRKKLGMPTGSVALLVNTNSEMGPYEASNDWDEKNWGPIVSVGDVDEDNDNIDLKNAVAALNNSNAAVVSGDPYFMSQRKELAKLINANKKWVCYPFAKYLDYADNKKSIVIGADLEAEYEQLGKKAKQILDAMSAIPNVGVTKAEPIFLQRG